MSLGSGTTVVRGRSSSSSGDGAAGGGVGALRLSKVHQIINAATCIIVIITIAVATWLVLSHAPFLRNS